MKCSARNLKLKTIHAYDIPVEISLLLVKDR